MGLEQPAVARDQAAQHRRIGVVDVVHAFRSTRRDHLVAGHDDAHLGFADRRDLIDAQRRQHTDILRPQSPACGKHSHAAPDVLADAADVLARPEGHRRLDPVRRVADILRRDHRIGTVGQRRAGHDAHRLAGLHTALECLSGERAADHAECKRVVVAGADGFFAVHRVPVHRGAIERRHVGCG